MTDILAKETIRLNAEVQTRTDAIKAAGQLLVDAGRVEQAYVDGMLAREQTMSTYVGNGVAIPHATFGDLKLVKQSGISFLQIPNGVEWMDGEKAYIVLGIASQGEDHIGILQNLAEVVEDEDRAKLLAETDDPEVVLSYLNKAVTED